jgi:hypothetical protein
VLGDPALARAHLIHLGEPARQPDAVHPVAPGADELGGEERLVGVAGQHGGDLAIAAGAFPRRVVDRRQVWTNT